MGLDQQVYIIENQKKLKDFYVYRFGDPNNTTLFDDAEEPEELYLHNSYAVQGFMKELALKKGVKDENEMDGTYIRITDSDVKELYKTSKDLDALKAYADKWRKGSGKFTDEYNQGKAQEFCRNIMKYIAFDEFVAYYEADW